MSGHRDWERRFEAKSAKKILASLYGEESGPQVQRYIALAEAAALDAAAGGDASPDLRFYSAPGRTELGGNQIDHNRGRVLCAAVRLDAVACIAPTSGQVVRLVSEGYPEPIVVDLSSLAIVGAERGTTAALIRGVAKGLRDYIGKELTPLGFVGRLSSTILPGSGLSSSAAIEVLLGTIMADLTGVEVPPVEIAKIGQFAENQYFGKPCGLMDQTASAVGGITSIDFADPSVPKIKRLGFDFAEEGYDLVVVNTGGSHADLTADYAAVPSEMMAVAAACGVSYLRDVKHSDLVARGPEIRKACGDRALLRAFHFVAENERVVAMVQALEADDLGAYLKLVKKSGRSSWELAQNVYAPSVPSQQGLSIALALSAEFIRRKGAWRVHGGGFAGTIQAYLPKKMSEGYAELMTRYFGPGSVLPIAVRGKGALRVPV